MPAGQSAVARTSLSCASPGQLGCVCELLRLIFPSSKSPCFLFRLPGPISSQVGGAPRSGVYINSEARNKDEGDPGEKGSLHTSIYNTSAPPRRLHLSTQAPLCVPGLSTSPVPFTESVLGDVS